MSTNTLRDEATELTTSDPIPDGGYVEPGAGSDGTLEDDGEGEGREETAELAIDRDALEWDHSYDRTPYANLKALVRELPAGTPDTEINAFAFRHICGLGPTVTPHALDRIREEHDIDPEGGGNGGDGR